MTRWADPLCPAREHNEPLLGAVGTPDAGEPAAGIAAVKILLDHLLDDRPEKTILPLETTLPISPAVWWNSFEYYGKIQAFYKANPTLKKDVFVSLADESGKEPERYARLQEAFEKSAPRGTRVYVQFFKQENHITTVVAATTAALMKIFAGLPPSPGR